MKEFLSKVLSPFEWFVVIVCLVLLALTFAGCAHAPTTQTVEVPIAVRPAHVENPKCPDLPIKALRDEDTWDVRLKAWWSTIIIQDGCIKAKDKVLEELNK